MTILARSQQVRAFRWVVLLLSIGAAATFVPLWAPLVLATWVAVMARPLLVRFAQATRGRHRAAGALVLLLVIVVFVPVGLAIVSLTRGALDLAGKLLQSDSARSALVAVVSGGEADEAAGGGVLDVLKSPSKIIGIVQEHGAAAVELAGNVAGAATQVVLGLFVFFYAVYVFLVDGPSYYDWLEKHAPIDVAHTKRLASAFNETGRGLFVGIGLTGLSQGAVATITYFALGVPRALVLGMLTCVASLIPSIGTALVWVPIAIGLALAGKTASAAIMTAVGFFAVSTVDNLLRPFFARFGKLDLST